MSVFVSKYGGIRVALRRAKRIRMLSIIIPTYNRLPYLRGCLDSLLAQPASADQEIIVVDNSDDGSAAAIQTEYPQVHLVAEPTPGLSHARNRGLAEATHKWVLFLDDDVRCPAGFLERALYNATQNDFTLVGGYYVPWYPQPRPAWLSPDYGRKAALTTDRRAIVPGQDGYLSGGILLGRTEILRSKGGFSTDHGMHRRPGYGEEDELQWRLHQLGFFIGFDPDWWLEHAVLPHKYELGWQIHSAYARRRDAAQPVRSGIVLAGQSIGTLATATIKLPWRLYRVATDRDYHWQNLLLSTTIPVARRWGDWVRWGRTLFATPTLLPYAKPSLNVLARYRKQRS